ncbi:MAG: hypothetical protein ACKOOG_09715 [Actinomycetota bacterium]
MARVLLLGVPRSGTTWCGRVLGHTAGAAYVNAPDGDTEPYAFTARLGFGGPPHLDPDDDHAAYVRLWIGAFAGGGRPRTPTARAARYLDAGATPADRFRAWYGGGTTARLRLVRAWARPMVAVPAARHVIVKTVRAEFTAEWIAARFAPTVLLVERNPLNVLASWIDLGYALDEREFRAYAERAGRRGVAAPAEAATLERQAVTSAVMASALRDAAERHGWMRTTHEHLCVDSATRFATLADDLGLEWSPDAARFVVESDREGAGYRTERRTTEQPDRWRDRLTPDQVDRIRTVLARFPDLEVPAP